MQWFTQLFCRISTNRSSTRPTQRHWRPRTERLETRAMMDGSDDLTVTLTYDDGAPDDLTTADYMVVDCDLG
jgi:hypothetical protein